MATVVEIEALLSARDEMSKVLAAAASKTKQEGDKIESTFERIKRRAGEMGERAADVGKKWSMRVTAPIVAGAGLAIKAAMEEAQQMDVLANTIRNNVAGATDEMIDKNEEWITSMQNATGIADGDLRDAMQHLLISGMDLGEAQRALAIAMDISVAKGKDLAAITEAMGKANQGNVGALGRLGIATRDASGEMLSFDEVLQNAADTMGGAAAEAADTAAGRAAILRAKFADLVENIGMKLMPTFERLVGWVSTTVDWLSSLPPWAEDVAFGLAGMAAAGGPLLILVGKLATSLGTLQKVLGAVTKAGMASPWVLLATAVAGAAVALGAFGVKAAEARAEVGDLTEHIREMNGEIDRTRLHELISEGDVREFREAGISMDEIAAAVKLASTSADGGAAAFEQLRDRVREANEWAWSGANITNQLTGKLDVLEESAIAAGEAIREQDDGFQDYLAHSRGGQAILSGTALAVRDQEQAFDDATDAVDEHTDALQTNADKQRALVDPIFAVQQAHRAAKDAQVEYDKAVREFGPNSEAALDALGNLTSASYDLKAAVEKADDTDLDGLREELETSYRTMGYTAEEAKRMAEDVISEFNRINNTPLKDKTLTIRIREHEYKVPPDNRTYGGGRAGGGRVHPGVVYDVGEFGREKFVPDSAGVIIPAAATPRPGGSRYVNFQPRLEVNITGAAAGDDAGLVEMIRREIDDVFEEWTTALELAEV